MAQDIQQITADQLQPVLDQLEKGLYMQAFLASRVWGPPHTWRGTRALIFGGRLVRHLGASTLSDWLMRRAMREDPSDSEAQYHYAYYMWRRQGPYAVTQWMNQRPELPGSPKSDTQASWYALLGTVAGMLRDFDTAEHWQRRAFEVAPNSPWIEVCQALLLELEDQYEEALQAARRALELRPYYRPAVQLIAHLLTLLDRDEEAVRLLLEASENLESSSIIAQLYSFQLELKLYEAARNSLERFIELSPLADKHTHKWLAAQRSEIAYRLGDIDEAIRHAQNSDNDFLKVISERLKDPSRAGCKTVLLPVGFVRQHHMTCAPATLSAISRYWSMPADHLQVADEICYNGTSSYSQRKWAQENGWVAREFTVTETSAIDLLDRGIPFTLTSIEPSSSHLQAVIGYDRRRGTLVIRDPYWRNSSEAIAEKLLKHYKAHGPRGMVLVPAKDREQLDSIVLPDVELWDQIHALDGALIEHRRTAAQDIYDRMQSMAPGHVLVHHARHRLAIYDGNPTEQLAAVEKLLETEPEDQTLQLMRLTYMRDLVHRQERLDIYQMLCDRKETHTVFWQQYAQELNADARRHDDAIWLLRRAILRWPTEATNYYILANIYWSQRKFDEALQLYRFAACLEDKNESFAQAYFSAATCRKQTNLVIRFLRDRFVRSGRKSSLPARTLFSAYLQLDRTSEALEVLERALLLRPDDEEFLLFAADAYLSCSTENMPSAETLLRKAEKKCPPREWLRIAARMASSDGRISDALSYWQQVLDIQPMAIDAHRAVTQLLAETKGLAAALEHLEQAVSSFPHYFPLQELRIQWVHDEPLEVREQVIRQVIEVTPDNAGVHREMALLLTVQRKFEEAWEQIDVAVQLEPTNSYNHTSRAYVLRLEGKIDEAKSELRYAVQLSVDNDYAIGELIDLCESVNERREVLGFVKEQLVGQVILGAGLLEFRTHARNTFEPAELLELLREGMEARPDLWHAWSAVITQLLDMKELDEAAQLSHQATERFPLLPRLWLDRASVCRARGEDNAERVALETAHQINPNWGVAVRALCDFHDRSGEYERTRQLLNKAIARTPLDVVNHILLAQTLWKLDEREAALDRINHAVQLNPANEYAWNLLNHWTDELGCPERALESARKLTQRRAGETHSWMILARLLDAPEQLDERLDILEKVVKLNPRSQEAYDLRALSLANAGRWTEAQQACCPPPWEGAPPILLRARAAWIVSEQGNLKEAIARMRDVVRDDPFYYEGWSRLSEWYVRVQDSSNYLETAEMMVRLRPHYEFGYGCLGEARFMNGDRVGAIEAYRHALELSPSYEYAAESLFDLQLEDGDISGAEETLSTLQKHANNAFVVAREAALAIKRNEKDTAVNAFRRVCLMQCESSWPITSSVKSMADAHWWRDAERILEDLLFEEKAHPETGPEWIRLCTERNNWRCADRLPKLVERGETGLNATYAYIDALVQANDARGLKKFIKKHREWLCTYTYTWGSVGYGLIGIRDYKLAAKWQADWRDRPDVEPWMLMNTVQGFRALSSNAEAAQVSQAALSMPQRDFWPEHHIWLAVDEACAGNIEAATQHLQNATDESLNSKFKFLITVVECVVRMAEAPPGDARRVFRKVKLRLKHARFIYQEYTSEDAGPRAYRRCLKAIAKYRKGVLSRLWLCKIWIASYFPSWFI